MASKLCYVWTRSICSNLGFLNNLNKLSKTHLYSKKTFKWTSSLSILLPKTGITAPASFNVSYCTTSTASNVNVSGSSNSSNFYPCLADETSVRKFLRGIDGATRDMLQREMERFEEEQMVEQLAMNPHTTITNQQAWKVFLFNGVPFIGFGLLDNVIMIIAGEYIDATIGAALGISTMAAAALGNLISDLAGVGTAGYVEALASRCGIQPPEITPAQSLLNKTRYMVALGRAVGVAVGCLLGMFPLLFFDSDKEEKEVIIEVKGATTIEKAAQTDPASVKPK